MNNIKVRKAEQKLLDEVKSGLMASKVMKNISVSDRILQDSGDEGDGSKKNSLSEESRNRDIRKKDSKNKKDDNKKPKEEKVDFKDIQKLAEEMSPKLLRKLISNYVAEISKYPDDQNKRNINIPAIVSGLNSDKSREFFEDFFVSLGQNCRTAEKAFKVGHLLVTMAQIKTIRGKGILTKKDISYEEVTKKAETQKPVENVEKTKHDQENNVVEKKKAEDIMILDDDVDHDLPEEDVIVNSILDLVIDKATRCDNDTNTSQNKSEGEKSFTVSKDSIIDKLSTVQLRTFLKHFVKMIDNEESLSTVAANSNMSETEARDLAGEVTRRCQDSPVTEAGTKQSFKLQNVFINSQMVEKFAKFNYQ